MIGEAIDTIITLGWALLGWIIVFAIAGTIIIFTALATGAYAGRGLWRAAGRPAWARSRLRARLAARRTRRDYEEAA
ncbi:hypothetical protein ACFY78_36665 [Streptomyces olindensis]|uniref:hypothetical protein n=1 Tax=Streptomyces olindensis TaxID=358823 RepID=UPI0036AEDF00